MVKSKLIQDKIPKIVEVNNEKPITYIADDKEYWEKLKENYLKK